jgi:hypothetical protein
MPVWFVWDGADSVTMYSQLGARVRNIEANPRVTLNFGGDGRGGDIVVLSGTGDRPRRAASRPGRRLPNPSTTTTSRASG